MAKSGEWEAGLDNGSDHRRSEERIDPGAVLP